MSGLYWKEGAHVEQLNQFIMSNCKRDVYKSIDKLVVFSNVSMQLSRTCLIEMAEMIKPRPNNESSLNILHREKLIDEFFFNNVLTRLVQKDAVQENTKWHTSLSDTSKKVAAFVYNPLLKIAKNKRTSSSCYDSRERNRNWKFILIFLYIFSF